MSSDVQQRQNQSAGIHLLQSNKEESLVCEKEKESGALKQDPENGNPSSQSDDLQQRQNATRSIKREEGAADMVKGETKISNQENQFDKITEKSRNPDAVHKLQADEKSIPREIPKTIDDAVTHKSERIVSVKKEKAPDDVQSLVSDIPASQCRQQKSTYSTIPEKALSKFDIVATPSSFVHVIPKQESEQCSLLCNEEKSVSLEKNILSDDNFSQIPTSEQHFSFSAKPEKAEKLPPRRNPDPGVQGLQSDPESKVPEKAVDDGYNWRKYGQKLVKGNEFIRSYYRCTFPNCLAKKQLERSHDGNLKDINYLGNHEHPKPQHSPHVPAGLLVRRPESSASGAVPEPITAHEDASQCTEFRETTQPSPIAETADGEARAEKCNENDGCPDSKRQKTEISGVVDNLLNKPNIDSRHVVHTISEIDIVNDGYRWRKYGQKFVKGNPNPRSYYRCTYAGCPVKKHVERASHDPKMVITTYEGQHEHGIGTSSSSASSSKTAAGTESRSTHAENKPVGLDMAVHISANS